LIRDAMGDPDLVFTNSAARRLKNNAETAAFQARRYRVYAMPDGSRVEMAAIENRTETSQRDRFRDAVLSGQRPIPIAPLTDFYFVLRRSRPGEKTETVRMNLYPDAWLGAVDEPGEVEYRKNDWVIRIPLAVFIVQPDQTRHIQASITYSLTRLKEIEREDLMEMRHLHRKQTFEIYRKGKRVAAPASADASPLARTVCGVIVDENHKPIPQVPMIVEWVIDIPYTLFKFKRFYHDKFIKTDANGYFSFRSTGLWFDFLPYLEGYVALECGAMPKQCPITLVMPRNPPDADRLTPSDFIEINGAPPYDNKQKIFPSIGYSLGTEGKPPGAPPLGGWTTNREWADLWISQYPGTEPIENDISAEDRERLKRYSMLMSIEALHDTVIQRVPQPLAWGMDDNQLMREAPADGYTRRIVGTYNNVVPCSIRSESPDKVPSHIFFRKGDRHGRIMALYFDYGRTPIKQGGSEPESWKIRIDHLRMQARPFPHRTLVHQGELGPRRLHPKSDRKKDPRLSAQPRR